MPGGLLNHPDDTAAERLSKWLIRCALLALVLAVVVLVSKALGH